MSWQTLYLARQLGTRKGHWIQTSFNQIRSSVPNLQVDLFATSVNYKFPVMLLRAWIQMLLQGMFFHSRLESLDNDLFVFCNESDVEGLEELTQYKGKFALVTSMWSNKFLVPSTEIVSLLQARLSEQVGKEIAFASSSLNQSLHVWVSYHSSTNDSIQPKM